MRLFLLIWGFCSCFVFTAVPAAKRIRLINGNPVPAGQWTEVVKLVAPTGSICTGTVVGPRAVLTAAHCGPQGSKQVFKIGETSYEAKLFRSSKFPSQEHDVGIAITTQDIQGVSPATIGGKTSVGLNVKMLGYGCTQDGGGGTSGVLHIGDSTISEFPDAVQMVLSRADGAVLCFGDSGGPSAIVQRDKHLIVGVHSKGNVIDISIDIRTDAQDSIDFFNKIANEQSIQICGINKTCTTDPIPTPASCTLTADPTVVKLGGQVTLTLKTQGDVVSTTLDGVPFTPATGGTKVITPTQLGTISPIAEVTGKDGKKSNCSASYTVKEQDPILIKPTCQLVADPSFITLGKKLMLRMTIQGNATSAKIEGTAVSVNDPKLQIQPTLKGNFTAQGIVSNANGSNSCMASYTVDDGGNPTTDVFTVVPSYCGMNNHPGSKVSEVCLVVFNYNESIGELKVPQGIRLSYVQNLFPTEVFPIISRMSRPPAIGSLYQVEDLKTYTNGVKSVSNYAVLKTSTAVLTKKMEAGRDTPVSIEGYAGESTDNAYFEVTKLSPAARIGSPRGDIRNIR